MGSYMEEIENNNRAIRYAAEVERQKDNGTWRSAAAESPPPRMAFSFIQDDFSAEFAQLCDFLNGITPAPAGLDYKWVCWSLNYLEKPELFEKAIAGYITEYHYDGESDLYVEDQAWIKNTRKLIAKYHPIVCALEAEYQKTIQNQR